MRRILTSLVLMAAGAAVLIAQNPTARVRAWRAQHEREILRELFDFLSIPNVASNQDDIARNAQALTRMFERRRFLPDIVPTAGSPLVLAERKATAGGSARTITFYFHYDGQPVVASEWTHSPPFTPVTVGDRIYARSASDDKAPIVALLAAVDALEASNVPLTSTVRVIIEGEEEAGSPNLETAIRQHGDRIRGDALLLVDGPRHPSDRPTVNFGARGIMNAVVTVYGPNRDLHSGNYGNWAPNPALALARLLASMKDDRGRVLINGFYDDVTPLTDDERRAIAAIPDVEPLLMKTYGFAHSEQPSERLEARHNLPTLNINAIEAGGGVGGQGRTIIPASASARLDLRFVKHVDPAKQFARLVSHIEGQGYFIVERDPDETLRAAHPKLARVTRIGGYPAGRTPMDVPIARTITKAIADAAGGQIVQLPTLGGSAPYYLFSDVLNVPTIGLSLVNFDNNQHGPNENLRIQNLWEGIETIAAILTMP